MAIRRQPSTLPGQSEPTVSSPSLSSFGTFDSGSSATTIWGPGVLSARAINSLGQASLKAIERVTLRRKLSKIERTMVINNINIQEQVLQLSQAEYYDGALRDRALKILIIQIGSEEFDYLVQAMSRWDEDEIMVFLSAPEMGPLWRSNLEELSENQTNLMTIYRSSRTNEGHEIRPFLNFISALLVNTSLSTLTVLNLGILQMLSDSISSEQKEPESLDLREACKLFIIDLVECDSASMYRYKQIVSNQPLYLAIPFANPKAQSFLRDDLRKRLVWPRLCDRKLSNMSSHTYKMIRQHFTPNERKESWRLKREDAAIERLCEIEAILSVTANHLECVDDFFDVAVDVLELSTNRHPEHISGMALSLLVKCIAIGNVLWTCLAEAFALNTMEDNLQTLYRIVYPLLQENFEDYPTSKALIQEIRRHRPEVSFIDYFFDFAGQIAERSSVAAHALRSTDIVKLCDPIEGREAARRLTERINAGFSIPTG